MVRAIVGLAINLRALLPPALAVVPFVVMLVTSALVTQDQISRFRFAGYAIAPQLIADFAATPMTGTAFEAADFTITLPAGLEERDERDAGRSRAVRVRPRGS